MSHQVIVTPLLNGARHVVLHVYVKSDGVSPDLEDHELVDPADYGMTGPHRFFTIETIQTALSGFDARLKFEYLLSDTLIWVLPEAGSGATYDFNDYGGLKDRSNELDGTGKILFSTRGISAGDEGSFVLKLRK